MPAESESRDGARGSRGADGSPPSRGASRTGSSAAGASAAGASAAGASTTGTIATWKGFALLDFQIRAVQAIRSNQNVLVSAPTGAGKTLVAEYAIQDAVRRGRRCVYTSPIKALSNQKYRDFRDDPEIDVGLMTGDVTIRPGAQVLIMTTEILRNQMFENPGSLDDVDYVIFDEVHYMDDVERGSVWEECLIFAPPEIRFIALSATVANLDELGNWLREIRTHELSVVRSERRPVPLKHRFHTLPVGVFEAGRIDWVRRKGAKAKRPKRRGRDGRRRGRGPEEDGLRPLFDELVDKDLLPALVFSFSRKDCERLAYRNRHRALLNREEAARMQALSEELIELFQLGESALEGEVFRLARGGVAYHHAGMLPVYKEVVERMFTSGLLKMLFTTETFALGINMPARSVVFASLRKFDGIQFDWLRTRDYMQMAGRAGRQGLDDQGLVLGHIDPRDLDDAPVSRLMRGKPEPVESRFKLTYATILHLVEHLGRERLHEAWEKSFNQYQHRARSAKARERNQRAQRRFVDAHLAFLRELGYLDEADRLTPRGRVARYLHGYELQLTEMLFRGTLEDLPAKAIAVVFVGLVHESRRRDAGGYVPPRLYGGVRRHVGQVLGRIDGREAAAGIPEAMKMPDWGLTAAVFAWWEGSDFEELEEIVSATPGDVCRTFRMALQLMRQVRRAIGADWDLADRLSEAVDRLNRDEVDAQRQLELG